jgi:hypothetical protein
MNTMDVLALQAIEPIIAPSIALGNSCSSSVSNCCNKNPGD